MIQVLDTFINVENGLIICICRTITVLILGAIVSPTCTVLVHTFIVCLLIQQTLIFHQFSLKINKKESSQTFVTERFCYFNCSRRKVLPTLSQF